MKLRNRLEKRVVIFEWRSFGLRIKAIREERKLSLRDLEQQCGVGYNTICKIEQGRLRSSAEIIFIAFWADIDVRDYVQVNSLKHRKPKPAPLVMQKNLFR